MFLGRALDPDATALYAPSMAQIGLSAASVPPNCWQMTEHQGALKIPHSRKSG
ncbi:MAG: hypothetical protein HFI42_02795 [Lachnospiraceae bacterium]|nr:hypothetical protein [Lachnospiraceae bacterium]MCI9149414.1 hypothetical protein [Lachnospiraceae bacterium]